MAIAVSSAIWWQPQLGAIGAIAEDQADINQAIAIILTTPLGSDIYRPDFGSRARDALDMPQNFVGAFLTQQVTNAIARWEKRVTLTGLSIEPYRGNDRAQIALTLSWQLASRESDRIFATEVVIA